jgi:hypothetical protein
VEEGCIKSILARERLKRDKRQYRDFVRGDAWSEVFSTLLTVGIVDRSDGVERRVSVEREGGRAVNADKR